MRNIMRIFPRSTKATPYDALVRVNEPPGFFDEVDEVHVSVAFTWDLPIAEQLEKQWRSVAPTRIGGPATGEAGGEFIPGKYLKHGYVITSRGCPNRCWFCSVWKREGDIRELEIKDGWNVLDDNLLACSDGHIKAVFEMLTKQQRRPEFTGGLDASLLKEWHAVELRKIKPKQVFFAYDTPDDLPHIKRAGEMLYSAGFPRKSHTLRCFVLCGFPKDTMQAAEYRMKEALAAGFTPMAMLWRDNTGVYDETWRQFQRQWARPSIIYGMEPDA